MELQVQKSGSNQSISTSIAAKVITVMSATLSDQRDLCGNEDLSSLSSRCSCHEIPWIFCAEALTVCRDEPEKVASAHLLA
jgi:hypothetical protein